MCDHWLRSNFKDRDYNTYLPFFTKVLNRDINGNNTDYTVSGCKRWIENHINAISDMLEESPMVITLNNRSIPVRPPELRLFSSV
jgi:hypothetical protein